jgi:hypothetical protein
MCNIQKLIMALFRWGLYTITQAWTQIASLPVTASIIRAMSDLCAWPVTLSKGVQRKLTLLERTLANTAVTNLVVRMNLRSRQSLNFHQFDSPYT